jgi:hypothetical protein
MLCCVPPTPGAVANLLLTGFSVNELTLGASGFLKSGPTAHAPRPRETISASPFLLGYDRQNFQEKCGVAKRLFTSNI